MLAVPSASAHLYAWSGNQPIQPGMTMRRVGGHSVHFYSSTSPLMGRPKSARPEFLSQLFQMAVAHGA